MTFKSCKGLILEGPLESESSLFKHVSLQIGGWKGNCSLLCVPLDDFDLIVGINFFFF